MMSDFGRVEFVGRVEFSVEFSDVEFSDFGRVEFVGRVEFSVSSNNELHVLADPEFALEKHNL